MVYADMQEWRDGVNSHYTVSDEMSDRRRYELKKRGERMADTRRRIVEATVELHRTVGPAATRINEIARRAGVRRVTVYSHFPDDAALIGACSQHWRQLHPTPDPATWRAEADAGRRLRRALTELYGWYRETEPMTANVLRDMALLPPLRQVIEAGLGRYIEAVHGLLLETAAPPPGRLEPTAAVLRVAIGFPTWQALAPLGDAAAAELAAQCVELAARMAG